MKTNLLQQISPAIETDAAIFTKVRFCPRRDSGYCNSVDALEASASGNTVALRQPWWLEGHVYTRIFIDSPLAISSDKNGASEITTLY